MSGVIGITMGDPEGIGPEIIIKALAHELPKSASNYLIIGDKQVLNEANQALGTKLKFSDWAPSNPAKIMILDPDAQSEIKSSRNPQANVAAAKAMRCLEFAGQLCLKGKINAIVTAPVSKSKIIEAGYKFIGQTEFYSELAKTRKTAMMLMGCGQNKQWIRVVLVTTHLPLRSVPSNISPDKIQTAIELSHQACLKLRINKPRIAVCGLNPHAGENGKLGTEEIEIIQPVIQSFQNKGFDIHGPVPADSAFYHAYNGKFDIIVAMYHDQGLAPLKMIGFENGINWTLGLPFVRTSPDHGTAFDIAGKDIANPKSMISAIRLARFLTTEPNLQIT